MRTSLLRDLFSNFNEAKKLQAEILDKELLKWKQEQQLAGNGLKMTQSLEYIQDFCEGLGSIIWTMREQVKQLGMLDKQIP